jgi:hypothetical protein
MARATAHPDHQCIIRVCVRTDTLFFAWLAVPFSVIRVSASFADAADKHAYFFRRRAQAVCRQEGHDHDSECETLTSFRKLVMELRHGPEASIRASANGGVILMRKPEKEG